ncbi:MAG: hypothetical protein Q9M37_10845 [Desulfonauticus sp.]|nr:hypothetical protein [Desulfonauticus sp.]
MGIIFLLSKNSQLEQFLELVNEVHKREAYLILDIPINHTGVDSFRFDGITSMLYLHDDYMYYFSVSISPIDVVLFWLKFKLVHSG